MLGELIKFFNNILFATNGGDSYNWLFQKMTTNPVISIFGVNLNLREYFVLLCSYTSLIIIFVLCCLFVYKIIKLIGGLIR